MAVIGGFATFLDTVGDGSGSIEQNIDGSTTPVEFKYIVPEGRHAVVDTLLMTLFDQSLSWTDYGGLPSPLTNGIDLLLRGVEGELSLFPQGNIKSTSDWLSYGGDAFLLEQAGSTDGMVCKWGLPNARIIGLTSGEEFVCRINDDLTGLVSHRVRITGRIIPTPFN